MPRKADIAARLSQRIAVTEAEAAAALSLSQGTFRQLVNRGLMPRPRLAGERRLYLWDEVELAARALPRDGEEQEAADTWHDYGAH